MAVYTDDFNRADNVDPGTNWTEDGGVWAIVSNQMSCANGASAVGASTTTTLHPALADCEVSVTEVDTSSWDGGPYIRKQTATSTYYENDCYTGTSDLYRYVAGVASAALATGGITLAGSAVIKIKATGSGATVTVVGTYAGTQEWSYDDTNALRITGAGQTGLKAYNNDMQFDNFSVDDLASGATLRRYTLTTLGVG